MLHALSILFLVTATAELVWSIRLVRRAAELVEQAAHPLRAVQPITASEATSRMALHLAAASRLAVDPPPA